MILAKEKLTELVKKLFLPLARIMQRDGAQFVPEPEAPEAALPKKEVAHFLKIMRRIKVFDYDKQVRGVIVTSELFDKLVEQSGPGSGVVKVCNIPVFPGGLG